MATFSGINGDDNLVGWPYEQQFAAFCGNNPVNGGRADELADEGSATFARTSVDIHRQVASPRCVNASASLTIINGHARTPLVGAVPRHSEAWSLFWQDQGEARGCCANAPEIQRPIESTWANFARSLLQGANVLDLGCGSGTVGRALARANPAIRIIGVDFAAVRPSDDPRIEVMPGTEMESLPFSDQCIDAAVSQFGFEYGRTEDASSELARVLRPGAPLTLLVHHSCSPIMTDSRAHRQAIEAIGRADLQAAFLSGDLVALDRQFAALRRVFPYERIVNDAGHGLRQQASQAPAHRIEIWNAVQAALAPELMMLAALEEAAVSPENMQSWLRPLGEGFELKPPSVLRMPNGQPLCWQVEGICGTGSPPSRRR